VLGKCRLGGAISARTKPSPAATSVPVYLYHLADSLTAYSATGCRHASDTSGVVTFEEALRHSETIAPERQRQLESALLRRALLLSVMPDAVRIARLSSAGDALLKAQDFVLKGKFSLARAILAEKGRIRGPQGNADVSPDAVYVEARLWLAMGDTTTAT